MSYLSIVMRMNEYLAQTCQRLNICRQVLFTEVEMLDIIVYKTSCFLLGIYLPGFYDPKSISMRLSDIREFEL